MMQKGQTLIYLLIGLLILAIVAEGVYYLGRKRSQTLEEKLSEQNPAILPSSGDKPNLDDETASWKTYTSYKLKVSFNYPPEFRVTENYEKGKGLYDEGIFIDYNSFGGVPSRWMKITHSDYSKLWNKTRLEELLRTQTGKAYNSGQFTGLYIRKDNIIIGGKSAHVIEGKGIWETPPPLRVIVIPVDNKYLIIEVTYSNIVPDNSTKEASLEVSEKFNYIEAFDKILSTFKFTQKR